MNPLKVSILLVERVGAINRNLVKNGREPIRITGVTTMRETNLRNKIIAKTLRSIPVENSANLGTPDLCTAAESGWLWIELKISYGGKILVKKTQFSSMVADLKLPEHLQRLVLVEMSSDDQYVAFTPGQILNMRNTPSERGIWFLLPDGFGTMRLDNLLDKYGVYFQRKL